MLRISHARLIFDAALFGSIVFAPPWLTLIFAIALAARWRAGEVIVAGIFMDLYWMPHGVGLHLSGFPIATVIGIVLVFALEPLRRQLLLGPSIV